MLDIETLATILLVGRVVSVTFIILVLIMQWRLFKLYVDPEIRTFRVLLFTLAVIILFSNIVPIVIDLLTIFSETSRPDRVATISVIYAVSNSFTAALSSLTIWTLYFVARKKKPVALAN